MDLLLSGASGFLGKNLILGAPDDWRILAVYHNDSGFPDFVRRSGKSNVTPVRCDLESREQVAAVLEKHGRDWDSCLYLAAKVDIPASVRDPRGDLNANVIALLNVLDRIRVRHFVYFSSGAVYEGLEGAAHPNAAVSPTLPYAISKFCAERYVECYGKRKHSLETYSIVRFFGAYGPYEASHKIYTKLVKAFAFEGREEYCIYGDGRNLIDAMYVDDAVTAIHKLIAARSHSGIVDLAAGRPLSIQALVQEIARALGVASPRITTEGIAHESNLFWGSTNEMNRLFDFVPQVTLETGIRRFRDFLRQPGLA